jgi:hypothetical protein
MFYRLAIFFSVILLCAILVRLSPEVARMDEVPAAVAPR